MARTFEEDATMTQLYVKDRFGEYHLAEPHLIIATAKRRISDKFRRGTALTSPELAKEAMQLKLADYEHEVFVCMFLDHQHRLVACEELFRGTLDGAAVYPREVVKVALAHNASAVIFTHNHPSGTDSPSEADRTLTNRLRNALALVDIRVLDHFVVGGENVFSFAENGMM
jgi:DNA repair protein RadC